MGQRLRETVCDTAFIILHSIIATFFCYFLSFTIGTKRQRQTQHVLEEVDEQPIRKKRKTAWSDAEKSAVQRQLGAFMTVHSKLPGKKAIDECLKAEAVLKHRTWVNIKDYVRNKKVTKSRKTQPW